jgi:iron complex transport system substrate-binding protein
MPPFRRRWLTLVVVASCTALSACRSHEFAAQKRIPSDAAHRIVSLSPNTTEALFALGVGDEVVGRSRFCDYPPAVAKIPSVGGYVDASLEAILALAPDLVVGARGPAGPMLVDKLTTVGVPTFFPAVESMSQIDEMLQSLGARVGAAARARELVEEMRAHRDAIRGVLQGEPVVRVLLLFGLSPIVAAGPGSFPDEMIALARGVNVVDSGGAYPTLSAERLLVLAPDVVLDAAEMTGAPLREAVVRADPNLRGHPALGELAAVREGRVVALYDEAVLRPGPRIADGLATLARALHPAVQVP